MSHSKSEFKLLELESSIEFAFSPPFILQIRKLYLTAIHQVQTINLVDGVITINHTKI